MTPEAKLQQKMVKLFKQSGILAHKMECSSTRGWPDLTLIYPSGVVVFVEVKTPRGTTSTYQDKIHAQIRERKGIVYVIDSIEQAATLCTAH